MREKKQMGSAASLNTVVHVIAVKLATMGASFKKVSGQFVSQADITKFLNTLFTLSSVGVYDTTIAVGGVVYPLNAFQVDTRIATAFVMPRAVRMPGTNPFITDVSVHHVSDDIMNPAEMIEFQHKFFNMFKLTPNMIGIEEAIKPRLLGDLTDVTYCGRCHVEDLASVKSVPVELEIANLLYEDNYFTLDFESVIDMVVVNFLSLLK